MAKPEPTPNRKIKTRSTASPAPRPPGLPLPNYSLSTVCPACNALTIRRACKVRCQRCGFVWDCSEL